MREVAGPAGRHPTVSTVINFCTLDQLFIRSCVEQALKFSEEVLVVYYDRFLDGTEEDRPLLDRIVAELSGPRVRFLELAWNRETTREKGARHWHNLARWTGVQSLEKSSDRILLLDADEVVDGSAFREWIGSGGCGEWNAVPLACRWYFREPGFQSLTDEIAGLLVRRDRLGREYFFSERERWEFLEAPGAGPIAAGPGGEPMVHHFSWVRTKEEMLRKVSAWGHKGDKDWASLVEEEFARPFNGTDFVHGYRFRVVDPPFRLSGFRGEIPAQPRDTGLPVATIVVPVFNNWSYTRGCLDSLYAVSERTSFEVVVVDDCSSDETASELAGYPHPVEVVRHERNCGFAVSCNDGARIARGQYVVFLNNDTVVLPGWLDALVETMAAESDIGAAGNLQIFPATGMVQQAGIVCGENGMVRSIYSNELPADHPAVNHRRDFQFVAGSCMILPRALFERVGGFDEAYLNSCEDVDLCMKVRSEGFRVSYVPASRIYHYESKTVSGHPKNSPNYRRFLERWGAKLVRDDLAVLAEDGFAAGAEHPSQDRGRANAYHSKRLAFDGRTFCVPDSVARGIGHYAIHHLEAILATRPGCDLTVLVDDEAALPDGIRRRIEVAGARIDSWSSKTGADFDLVHAADPMYVHTGAPSPFGRFASSRLCATFYDAIPLVHYRGQVANWPGYLARVDELRARGVELLCISERSRLDAVSELGIDPARARVVMAGFNASPSGKVWTREEGDAVLARLGIDRPFFLHVGAVDPHKNLGTVLAASQFLSRERKTILVVAGRIAHSVAGLREQILQAGLGGVLFTDFLPREELELLYSRAVATVFASRYEGFGFPVLEAMANGCPVVCSNTTSLPEVAGDAALLHDPDDAESFARSMLRLLDDPALREDLVARGRSRAAGFRWEDVARRTWEVWDGLLVAPAPRPAPSPEPARVQWVAPVWDPSGYGDESRAFVRHLAGTDLGVGLLAWGRHSETFRQAATSSDRALFDGLMGRETARGRVVVIDAPAMAFGRVPGGGVHVGRTTFETDGLPADWVARCEGMDEIWVPCAFNRETFVKAGVRKPVLVVPEGVDTDRFRPGLPPLPLPGPGAATTYLAVFEWTHRKGPDLLLRAWAEAFGPGDDVRLVLRTYPPNEVEGDPAAWVEARIDEELSRIGRCRSDCAPLVVLAAQVPDADMPRLYAAADVYLAPSRGEGWGRPHMEAMSCGVPVVATRWSGNLDFQDDDNSWLIDLDGLEEIDAREEFAFYRGQKWARPSLPGFVRLLRASRDEPATRRIKGERARRDMVELWDWKRIAPIAERRIREILAGVPAEASALAANAGSAPEGGALRTRPAETAEEGSVPVRWSGQLFNFSGYARLAREAVSGLAAAGAEITLDPLLNDRKWFEGLARDRAAFAGWKAMLEKPARDGILVSCDVPRDAEGRNDLFAQMREAHPGCLAQVGWTMFETDRLPTGWAESLSRLDQVWVPSRFNLETFAASGVPREKLHVVPGGIDPAPYAPERTRPMALPGPARSTTFLSVFQWVRRKGWDVLLRAWAEAFGPGDDVRLVIRAFPFGQAAPVRRQMEDWLASQGLSPDRMAPVVLLEDFVAEPDMPSLYAACDVFVLPSRGEGWGLPYLEAMAAGKPVIGTAWGAATDFLHDGLGWMLPATAVPVDAEAIAENPFLDASHRWAEPSREELVRALREAAGDPGARRTKGENARREALSLWTPEGTARAMAEALDGLEPGGGEKPVAMLQGPVGDERLSGVLAAVAAGLRTRGREPDRGAAGPERAFAAEPGTVLSVRWEGSQFVHHSLALVNRELCLRLAKMGQNLSIIPFEPDQFGPGADPDLGILATLSRAPLEGPCQVHVRHQWPPNLEAPAEGRWVAIQPWEFGSPPRDWMPAFRDRLDDLWVPSTYCRDLYLAAGLDPERVAVVPNGVDCARFRPGLEPLPGIPRDDRLNFLFVGGSIARKGFDVLLNAWQAAFGPEDPVRLVVKDMGGKSFYQGQGGAGMLESLRASGRAAPVHYLDEDLDPADLPRLYAACDVLVHPYRGEGFGLPIAEAMACGLPVVATEGGAADDFCGPDESWRIRARKVPLPGGKVGSIETVSEPWWLEPDAGHLASLLREVLASGEARAAKGTAARNRIVRDFTWERAAEIALERLRRVAARPARRAREMPVASAPRRAEDPAYIPVPLTSEQDERLASLLFQLEGAVGRRDLEAAERISKQAVEDFPGAPMAWVSRSMVLRGYGRHGQAVAAAGRALESGGGPEALFEALVAHLLAGKDGKAREFLKRLKAEHVDWLAVQRELYARSGVAWPPDQLQGGKSSRSSAPKPGNGRRKR